MARSAVVVASAVALTLIIVGAGYAAYWYFTPHPCCAPEPAKGQLFLESYNFQTNGSSGSFFVVLGAAEGAGLTFTVVSLDSIALTRSNSNLTTSCGTGTYGSWVGYGCTMTVTFGPSFPAPASGSTHDLEIVTSSGVTSTFEVTAGYLYEATSTTGQ